MLRSISFISALVGVGFAATAALLPDTGIDGTLGAFLALLGAVAVTLALGLVLRVKGASAGVFAGVAALLAILTALAAWFLMQDVLLVTMIVALVALLASGPNTERKIVR